jgi:hypothetical protein
MGNCNTLNEKHVEDNKRSKSSKRIQERKSDPQLKTMKSKDGAITIGFYSPKKHKTVVVTNQDCIELSRKVLQSLAYSGKKQIRTNNS